MASEMKLNMDSVVNAVQKYEKLSAGQKGKTVQWGDRIVLYRKHFADGKVGLECRAIKDLDVSDRVRLLFGDEKFRLNTVSELIARAESLEEFKKFPKNDDFVNGAVRIGNAAKKKFDNLIGVQKTTEEKKLSQPSSLSSTAPTQPTGASQQSSVTAPTGLPKTSTQTQFSTQNVAPQTAPNVPDNPAMTLPCDPARAGGVPNPGHHCYFNASLKALWASTSFRDTLQAWIGKHPGGLAELVKNIFTAISNNKPMPKSTMFTKQKNETKANSKADGKYLKAVSDLSSGREPSILDDLKVKLLQFKSEVDSGKQMSDFRDLKILGKLDKIAQEEDAQELIVALFSAIFSADQSEAPSLTYLEHVDRPRSGYLQGKEELAADRKGNPPKLEDVYVPSLDSKKTPELESMTRVKIPEGVKNFNVQDYFTGYKDRDVVEVDTVVGADRNRKLFFGEDITTPTSQQKKQEVEKYRKALGVQPNKDPFTEVSRRYPIVADDPSKAPAFLPIQVSRFQPAHGGMRDEFEKDMRTVTFPYVLDVPIEKSDGQNAGTVKYVLKSVVVHRGSSLGSGHYVTYVPDPSSAVRDAATQQIIGYPTKWTCHSDSSVSTVPNDKALRDMESNGYILMYDRLDPPLEPPTRQTQV